MCPNEKMTGMANLIIELGCAWLNLTGYLSVFGGYIFARN
jgi:hypothetical protein